MSLRLVKTVMPALVCSALALSFLSPPPARAGVEKQRPTTDSYHDLWRKLWEDHITWTRMVIMGTFDNLPGLEAYKVRLLKNYEDMEDALAPYYGEDAEELGDLIEDHLLIAVELLNAAKAGNTTAFNDANARWYANGHDIAVKMAEMNPRFWPLSMGDPMWKEHLDATLDEAVKHSQNNFAGDIAAYDRVHDLALEMADFVSDGVMSRFHNQFKRSADSQVGVSVSMEPTNLRIGAMRPNPTRESAAVTFSLVQGDVVRAGVYDASGRLVRDWAAAAFAAGDNALNWDLRNRSGAKVAPGVYLMRLTGSGGSVTGKVLVAP